MKKRILSILLVLCLLCPWLPAAQAYSSTDIAYPVEGGYIYFNSTYGTITDCDESVTVANIPTKINGVTVKYIGKGAFAYCQKLSSVTLPEYAMAIRENAFSQCTSLKGITIPEGLTSIGAGAFEACDSMTSITLSNTVGSIGEGAFRNCTGLKSITIPSSVHTIGDTAFDGCDALEEIIVESNNTTFSSQDGVLFASDMTVLHTYPKGKTQDTYKVPNTVETIDVHTFYYCNYLTEVELQEGVTSIQDGAFTGCGNLRVVNLPESLRTIGNEAFMDCASLERVDIPMGVTSIGAYAFTRCGSMTDATLPATLTSLGYGAFMFCTSLKGIVIPEGVSEIQNNTFDSCTSLTDATLPTTLTSIGDSAFWGCTSLTGITLPKRVTYIGSSAFRDCACLQSLILPQSLTAIGNEAFSGCTALTNVTIPGGVTSIGDCAFSDCTSLWHVHFLGTMPTVGGAAFENCASNLALCILEDAQGWEDCSYPTELWDYTCTADCQKFTYTCNLCGGSYTFASNDAHTWVPDEDSRFAPTCTEPGSVACVCAVCGVEKIQQLPATGHRQGELVDETEIYWEYACLNGDHTFFIYKDNRVLAMQLQGVTVAFSEGESYPWVFSKNDSAVNCNAIKSSNQGISSSTSSTSITFTSEKDFTLSFAYMVSSESVYDALTIQLDDTTIVDAISGSQADSFSTTLCAGAHTLSLSYSKDDIVDSGTDSGYLYHIEAKTVSCDHEAMIAQEAVPASCTEAGNIAYWFCKTCGGYFADAGGAVQLKEGDTVIAPLGHSYTVYTDNGENHTVACDRCGDSKAEEHSYADGECICGAVEQQTDAALTFYNASIGLEDKIIYSALVNQTVTADYDSYYVEFVNLDSTDERMSIYKQDMGTAYGSRYTLFQFPIYVCQMTDRIEATLYGVKDGVTYEGQSIVHSVEEFVLTLMPNLNEKMQAMAANMLEYGAMMQLNFGHRTDHLANDELGSYADLVLHTAPTAVDSSTSTDNSYIGASLYRRVLGISSTVELQYAFNLDSSLTMTDLRAEITVDGKTTVIDGADFTPLGTRFVVIFSDLLPTQGDVDIEITIYSKTTDQPISETYTDRLAYAVAVYQTSGNENITNAVNAMLNYYRLAQAAYQP